MVPVRTGLDERLHQLRNQLVDDANELMRIYSVAVDSLISLDVDNVNQVLAARDEARRFSGKELEIFFLFYHLTNR